MSINDQQHGSRAGGTLHAEANGSTAGFLPASLKTVLDAIPTNIALVDGFKNTVTTTNATETAIHSYTIPNNAVICIYFRVVAASSASANAGYTKAAAFKRTNVAATQIASTVSVAADREENAAMDVRAALSGTSAQILVTGLAATTIKWSVHALVFRGNGP